MLIIYKILLVVRRNNRNSKLFKQTITLGAQLKNPKILLRKHLLRDQILSAIISKTKSISSTSTSMLLKRMVKSILVC